MIITLEIPDQVAALISSQRPELERAILEGFAVEAYREGTLSCMQVRLLLGHEFRWETEDFLAAHDAWPDPTEDEVVSGANALRGTPQGMIVVSDTSPLRYLILIGQAGLLENLYGCVACPERVVSECCHPSAPAGVRAFMGAPPSWLVIYPDPPAPELLIDVLDPGETAAIALAEQLPDSVLLMDERKGRRLAEARGLQVAGTLNVLAQSGAAGLIDFRAIIAQLRRETNFRVSDAIVEKAWTAAQS